jgi:multiple sugar transport system ATP-binding protein
MRVREVAATLELDDLLDARPGKLTGGQRQRVALGRAIIRNPKMLLLDKPLSNLDALLRTGMRGELKRIQRRRDVTTIYVTHNQTEAMTLGDRIAVLKDGELQRTGEPGDIYHRPANRFVAGFIGTPPMDLLDGSILENAHKSAEIPGIEDLSDSSGPEVRAHSDHYRNRRCLAGRAGSDHHFGRGRTSIPGPQ